MTTLDGRLVVTGKIQVPAGPWVNNIEATTTNSGEFVLPSGYHTTTLNKNQTSATLCIVLEAD